MSHQQKQEKHSIIEVKLTLIKYLTNSYVTVIIKS